MRILKQALGMAGALTVIAITVALIAPQRVQAVAAAFVQIVPGSTTHVGQYESAMVFLYCTNAARFCWQINSEGNGNPATAYTVPTGYTLVITDYQWQAFAGRTGYNACDFLESTNGGLISAQSCALADPSGDAYNHEHFITGLRAASGLVVSDSLADQAQGVAAIEGYLVPND